MSISNLHLRIKRRRVVVALLLAGMGTSSCAKRHSLAPASLIIKSNNAIELNGKAVTRERLQEELKALTPTSRSRPIVIYADPAAAYEVVVNALDAARAVSDEVSFAAAK